MRKKHFYKDCCTNTLWEVVDLLDLTTCKFCLARAWVIPDTRARAKQIMGTHLKNSINKTKIMNTVKDPYLTNND